MEEVAGPMPAPRYPLRHSWEVPVLIGLAVVSGPFIESIVSKLSGGRHRFTYLVLALVSFAQLLASGAMPETLPVAKRISFDEFSASLSSVNPFSFLKIYTGRNTRLKRLVTITTLQNFLEGRCTSDVFQMWARNNLKWNAETIRNYVSLWGGMSVAICVRSGQAWANFSSISTF